MALPVTSLLLAAAAAAAPSPSPAQAMPGGKAANNAVSGARSAEGAAPQRRAAETALAALAARMSLDDTANSHNGAVELRGLRRLRDATIGYGFEVNVIDPRPLLAGNPIDASLTHTGVWRFIVLRSGRPVGLITMARLHGRWQMVEFGAAKLAREIADVVGDVAQSRSPPTMRFIRSPQAVADFIEFATPRAHNARRLRRYVPLSSASGLFGAQAPAPSGAHRTRYAEREFVAALRAYVRRGLHDPRFAPHTLMP